MQFRKQMFNADFKVCTPSILTQRSFESKSTPMQNTYFFDKGSKTESLHRIHGGALDRKNSFGHYGHRQELARCEGLETCQIRDLYGSSWSVEGPSPASSQHDQESSAKVIPFGAPGFLFVPPTPSLA